ncbi:hypothetical protein TeGR_g3576, partial [Tetraparma gracilis]
MLGWPAKLYGRACLFLGLATLFWYACMYLVLVSDPALSRRKADLLDMSLLWTKSRATELFADLEEGGALRKLYIFYGLDLVFPFIYGPFLSIGLALFLRIVPGEGLPPNTTAPFARRVIAGLPVGASLFDLAENSTILYLVTQFLRRGEIGRIASMVGGVCTSCKWVFFGLPLLVGWFEIVQAPRDDEEAF